MINSEFDFGIVGIAPIPLPGTEKIEGAGIRAWNLADGLSKNGRSVLLIYPEGENRGILQINSKIITASYKNDFEILELIKKCKIVIGHGSHWPTISILINNRLANQVLVADMYVPIQIEYAARKLRDDGGHVFSEQEFLNKMVKEVISKTDYILCTSENQRNYYRGILVGIEQIPVDEYFNERIVLAPHGYHSSSTVIEHIPYDEYFHLAWVGAFYPWMGSDLASQILQMLTTETNIRIHVIGGINPFIGQHEPINSSSLQASNKLRNVDSIIFEEWQPYEKLNISYGKFDAVLHLNANLIESQLSWRTRLLDAIRFGVPIITDGLDTISEKLLRQQSAFRLTDQDPIHIVGEIVEFTRNLELREEIKKNLLVHRSEFESTNFTKEFSNIEPKIKNSYEKNNAHSLRKSKLTKIITLFHLLKDRKFRFIFELVKFKISNYFAPVLADFIFFYNKNIFKKKVRRDTLIVYPETAIGGANFASIALSAKISERLKYVSTTHYKKTRNPEFANYQETKGINSSKFKIRNLFSSRFIIVSSLDYPDIFWELLFKAVSTFSNLRILIWVHEDRLNQFIKKERILNIFHNLTNLPNIKFATPSAGTANSVSKYLKIKVSDVAILKYPLDDLVNVSKAELQELDPIKFYLSATSFDGRKNHAQLIRIFGEVIKSKTKLHRDFELHFVGIGEDANSLKIVEMGQSILGENFKVHGILGPLQARELNRSFDIACCISEFETLPIFITEALAMNQPILRNASSGLVEQLIDGFNGALINEKDEISSAVRILGILNINETKDDEIIQMGNNSKILFDQMFSESEQEFESLMEYVLNEK